ncbi:MAG: radical SAM protein [Acidobacteriota bacterium]|jgi:hypothetical protein
MPVPPRKLLLIQPPVEDFYDTSIRVQPLGLAYLKAAVLQFVPEVRVKIVDFHQGWGRRTLEVPRELSLLREAYRWPDRSPLRTFHQYYRFGATDQQMAEVIRSEQPDYVGISSLFSAYHREALRVAGLVREQSKALTILGGAHATAAPASLLARPEVDFVVIGEGERPLVELLRVLISEGPEQEDELGSISGLAYRVGQTLHLNRPAAGFPIELLPEPDFGDFAFDRYRYHRRPIAQLITSRGCPFRCSFCTVHSTFGAAYRVRSVEAVLEEMQRRFDCGVRVFDFEDDNLTFHLERMKELCRGIIERFPGQLELLAMNGISYHNLDGEALRLMRRAGFRQLNLSLVSSDPAILGGFRRPHRVGRLVEVVEEAHRLGFEIICYLILGLPHEPIDGMIETLLLLARLPVRLGASPFYLAPASAIADELSVSFDAAQFMLCRLTAMGVETPEISRRDIFTLFVLCRLLNFLKELPAGEGEKQLHAGESSEISLDRWVVQLRSGVPDRHILDGLGVAERLIETGRFYALTAQGEQENTFFNPVLFRRAWNRIEQITALDGAKIRTSN